MHPYHDLVRCEEVWVCVVWVCVVCVCGGGGVPCHPAILYHTYSATYMYILCCSAVHHCYHSSLSSLCPTASRVNDSAFLRDSVDFSDLLEDSVEREEDRKKK